MKGGVSWHVPISNLIEVFAGTFVPAEIVALAPTVKVLEPTMHVDAKLLQMRSYESSATRKPHNLCQAHGRVGMVVGGT